MYVKIGQKYYVVKKTSKGYYYMSGGKRVYTKKKPINGRKPSSRKKSRRKSRRRKKSRRKKSRRKSRKKRRKSRRKSRKKRRKSRKKRRKSRRKSRKKRRKSRKKRRKSRRKSRKKRRKSRKPRRKSRRKSRKPRRKSRRKSRKPRRKSRRKPRRRATSRRRTGGKASGSGKPATRPQSQSAGYMEKGRDGRMWIVVETKKGGRTYRHWSLDVPKDRRQKGKGIEEFVDGEWVPLMYTRNARATAPEIREEMREAKKAKKAKEVKKTTTTITFQPMFQDEDGREDLFETRELPEVLKWYKKRWSEGRLVEGIKVKKAKVAGKLIEVELENVKPNEDELFLREVVGDVDDDGNHPMSLRGKKVFVMPRT